MAEEKPALVCIGVVRGTPRTYGNSRNDDIWRSTIVQGHWDGFAALAALEVPLHLDFQFRINPRSPSYRGRRWDNGSDLDTMIIGAMGGLLHCRNPERPTLRLIKSGGLCKFVTATKSIIEDDNQAGFTLRVRPGDVLPFQEPPHNAGISFSVRMQDLKRDCRLAVQEAAECANIHGFRAPRRGKFEIALSFAEKLTRNPLSAAWMEGVIDGLGASRVGDERFFDGPPTQAFGYDDSNVFKLTVAHVHDLPSDIGLHISCKELTPPNTTDTY